MHICVHYCIRQSQLRLPLQWSTEKWAMSLNNIFKIALKLPDIYGEKILRNFKRFSPKKYTFYTY